MSAPKTCPRVPTPFPPRTGLAALPPHPTFRPGILAIAAPDRYIRPVIWLYRQALRPWLFRQDSETIHQRTLHSLAWVSRHRFLRACLAAVCKPDPLPIDLFGLHFPNPVGLAAGMDKLAEAVPAWESMGFGFSELGGVTRHAQPGNPLPRIFRIIPDEALINRMGFNNPGADAFAHTLQGWRTSGHWPSHPVGVNLGKSKVTPLEEAAEDYAYSLRQLDGLADFVVVNVSSPNTPNLRQLQDRDTLDALLASLATVQSKSAFPCPILLKMAPDLEIPALNDLVEIALRRGVAGLVATNTTLARPQHPPAASAALYAETGGLSGRPLAHRSTEVIRHLYRQSHGRLPIIGVGGIFSAADAWEKITAGASLVQVYSGLVYQGPCLPRAIVRGLRQRLHDAGFHRLDQAVGIANPLP